MIILYKIQKFRIITCAGRLQLSCHLAYRIMESYDNLLEWNPYFQPKNVKKYFCLWCINLIILRITLISFYFLLFYLYLDGCTKIQMYYFKEPALIELEGLIYIAVPEFFIYCPLLWAPAVPSINHHVLFQDSFFRYTYSLISYSRDLIFNMKKSTLYDLHTL